MGTEQCLGNLTHIYRERLMLAVGVFIGNGYFMLPLLPTFPHNPYLQAVPQQPGPLLALAPRLAEGGKQLETWCKRRVHRPISCSLNLPCQCLFCLHVTLRVVPTIRQRETSAPETVVLGITEGAKSLSFNILHLTILPDKRVGRGALLSCLSCQNSFHPRGPENLTSMRHYVP